MNWRRVVVVGCGWVAVLAAAAWAADVPWAAPARSARKVNPVAVDAQSMAAGKALYMEHCFSCHGSTGAGNGPAAKDLEESPGDLTAVTMWEQSDGALFWKITKGKTLMPGFETLTSETERWEIINYVRSLAPKAGKSISHE